jgi:LysR family hydrogen peroxide-inducible transcriptional activator
MRPGPHVFTLRQLQYAVAVADEMGFRKAAELCRVSQPSLSAQIKELEDALGTKLFERTPKRVLVTAAGRDLIERARRLLLAADELEQLAKTYGDPFLGTLRIGVIPTISPYLLPIIAPKIRAAYPRMTVVWVEEKTEVLAEQLQGAELDAAVVALESELGDVEHETIALDPFVLVTAGDDPLGTKKAPLSVAELKNTPVLLLDEGHCFREQALAVCSRARAEESEFRATSLSTLVQMVAGGGAGVTLLPQLAVKTEASRANITVRAFAKPEPKRTIVLAWRKSSAMAAALREIARTSREAFDAGVQKKRA